MRLCGYVAVWLCGYVVMWLHGDVNVDTNNIEEGSKYLLEKGWDIRLLMGGLFDRENQAKVVQDSLDIAVRD